MTLLSTACPMHRYKLRLELERVGERGYLALTGDRVTTDGALSPQATEILLVLALAASRPEARLSRRSLRKEEIGRAVASLYGPKSLPVYEADGVKKVIRRVRHQLALIVFGEDRGEARAWSKRLITHTPEHGYRLNLRPSSIEVVIHEP